MKNISKSNKTAYLSILTAISASVCCITPILATLAVTSGIATAFSWIEPFRPYLIGLTLIILCFAWYQKLKPKKETDCACDENSNSSFWQTKSLLLIITLFSGLMLAFPYYSDVFYGDSSKKIVVASKNNIIKETFEVKGMTCSGCEKHIENDVSILNGIISVKASYDNANTTVEFDKTQVTDSIIIETINNTGYKVVSDKRTIKSK